MDLKNEFVVAAPIEKTWELVTDVERIAPCIPGFQLDAVSGDEYRGTMKVKVGAVSMTYGTAVHFIERDDVAYRAVMAAEGRELRGQGMVTARITSTLASDGDGTRATIVTSLSVTGRVAQFGRGILADVSNRLVAKFVSCLEQDLLADDPPPAGPNASEGEVSQAPASQAEARAHEPGEIPRGGLRRVGYQRAEAVDLLDVAAAPLLKRLAPVAGGLALLALVLALLRRGR